MDKEEVKQLKNKAEQEIEQADNLEELDQVYKKYLAQNKGKLTKVLRSLGELPEEKRAVLGKEANRAKEFIGEEIDQKRKELEKEEGFEVDIDVTIPGEKTEIGHLHPLTQIKRRARFIFKQLGFSVVEGPEMETEWYNFDALNIPEDHPARDMWDTFWIKQTSEKCKQRPSDSSDEEQTIRNSSPASPAGRRPPQATSDDKEQGRLLLRTHTSPVQIRYMEKNNPPLRIIVPGRCFRHEKPDASHDIQFDQIEGLVVDRAPGAPKNSSRPPQAQSGVSVANFKAVMQEFLDKFFQKDVESRIRPSYFPFTEPSFEVDIKVNEEWVETLGAGMVHPEVLSAAGFNPERWQGFAFGIGVDRLAMMKHEIDDIRLFYENDLRFLRQF